MERASSSTACSSSSLAAPPGHAFPTGLMGERIQLIVRKHNIYLLGVVNFVAEDVCLKVVRPGNPSLRVSHSAELKAEDGRQWSGTISWVHSEHFDHDKPGFYDFVWIHMETSPVNPVIATQARVKVGVNGFGDIERLVIDMALQSLNLAPVKVWKSPNVSISVKDDQTVIFKQRYYKWCEKDVKRNVEKKRLFVKVERLEVTVLREPDQACWEKVNAHFVVGCGTCFNNDKDVQSNDLARFQIQVHDKESFDYFLRYLPQALYLRELYVVEPIMRAQLNNGDHDIVTSSKAEGKDVSHKKVSPDSNNDPTSLSFVASTVFLKEKSKGVDISRDLKMSNLDLLVTLEKSENCSETEGIHARLCVTSEEVGERLITITSLCLDIVRCMPVGGCSLKC